MWYKEEVSRQPSSCPLLPVLPHLQRMALIEVYPSEGSPHLVAESSKGIKTWPFWPQTGHLYWASVVSKLSTRLAKSFGPVSRFDCYFCLILLPLSPLTDVIPNKYLGPQTLSHICFWKTQSPAVGTRTDLRRQTIRWCQNNIAKVTEVGVMHFPNNVDSHCPRMILIL